MDKVEEILEAYKRLSAPDQYKVAENILNMEEESKSGFDTNNMRSDLEEVCHNRETCKIKRLLKYTIRFLAVTEWQGKVSKLIVHPRKNPYSVDIDQEEFKNNQELVVIISFDVEL